MNKNNNSSNPKYTSIGLPLSLVLGLIIDNIPIALAIGILVGVVASFFLGNK